MVRSILAVVVGFVAIGVLVVLTDTVMAALFPSAAPDPTGEGSLLAPPWYVAINLAYSALYAVVGGLITGWIARRDIMRHVYWLAGLNAIFAVVSFVQYQGRLPWWYSVAIGVIGVLGPIAGGRWLAARSDGATALA